MAATLNIDAFCLSCACRRVLNRKRGALQPLPKQGQLRGRRARIAGKNGQHHWSHVMSQLYQSRIISHRFSVGRMVRLSQAVRLRNAAPGSYEVLAQLPDRDGEFQYRLKSDREPYQRIAKEHELEPI
jgi:hypothetical protein